MAPADAHARFDRHAHLAESGLRCDQTLHFVAGPDLQGASTDRITILWETSQPTQAGGAGGHLEEFTPNRSWFTARSFRGHHDLTITLTPDRLALRAFDVYGHMIDTNQASKPTISRSDPNTYFPIQNRENTRPNTSSGLTAPKTSPRQSNATRKSAACNSIGPPCLA